MVVLPAETRRHSLRQVTSCPKPLPDPGEIALMIDSAVHGVDEVLQEKLRRASVEGIKNIVAA
ncbi:MAG: hypothetical protein ACQEUN_07735 [Pseudomonadota bacterium]